MKSPEEIKEGCRKCLSVVHCNNNCPYAEFGSDNCIDELQKDVTEYVDNLEERVAIQTDRPVAHWQDEDGKLISFNPEGRVYALRGSAYCSNCGEELTGSDEYACKGLFCPNCGAEMIEKE